jgi:hypothetical protein
METNQSLSLPEGLQHCTNGNSNGHKREQLEGAETYLSHSETDLANGKDWFQEVYRAGYLDGFTQGLKQGGANSAVAANEATGATAPSVACAEAKADHREPRLKGFPCDACGCASYSDETHCPCCSAAKVSSAGHPENGAPESLAHD